MAQREDETNLDHQESDKCSQMKFLLEKRNKILDKRIVESDFEDDFHGLSLMTENDNLNETSEKLRALLNKNVEMMDQYMAKYLHLLRDSSGLLSDEDEDEIRSDQNEQVFQTISKVQIQCEGVFKQITNNQNNFNNACLDIKTTKKNKRKITNILNRHNKVVERTCKIEKSIEALFNCNQNVLKEKLKDMKINDIDEFNKAANDLAKGFLTEVSEDGMKDFKNHEHLLAIKKSNKLLTEANVVQLTKLDPFTKQPITDPITNTICNHVYNQTSIDDIFKGKSFATCPYVGCKNTYFTKCDLTHY